MAKAKCVMVLGTASNVGKGSITLALARWLKSQGARVLPFKAMSMGSHSYQVASGGEIHVHQAQQAIAVGLEPSIDTNPIMFKTGADGRPSILVWGKPSPGLDSASGEKCIQLLRSAISSTYNRVAEQYDFIVVEGCGSPVELNVKERDLANLWLAQTFDIPCVLVASIESVGVFGSLIGTLGLMTEAERARIIGFIINKFHGDPDTFVDGVRILEDRTRLPCLGVIPFRPDLTLVGKDSPGDKAILSSREFLNEAEQWTDLVMTHLNTELLFKRAFGTIRSLGEEPRQVSP
jgi:adenosylcobyric acid synthase